MDLKRKLKVGAAVALAAVGLLIVLQNTEAVETQLLFTTITMPRAALLFATLTIGFVLGLITSGRLAWVPRESRHK